MHERDLSFVYGAMVQFRILSLPMLINDSVLQCWWKTLTNPPNSWNKSNLTVGY
ncbi:hypothetical protein LZ30DRAFT_743094 [Colletotrichum cereale]|nr:hypothetical protein LZ30DRAFT_743094 [Colletotrichum cereale]